jgi:SAM-dependent methyltransferase
LLTVSIALLLVAMLAAPALAQEQQCKCKRQCRQRCPCRRSTSSGCGGSSSADETPSNRRSPRPGPTAGRNVATNEVDLVAEVLDLQPGMVFAEIGAGNGRFSVRLADYVGPEGRVYANELGERRIRGIERMIEQAGTENVVAVAGEVDDTNLPEGEIDALMMRMVYHMMTDPEPMNRSFFRALKPSGTMLIIDGYPKSGPDAPGVPENRSGMGIDPDITIEEVTSAGFEYVRLIERWPNVGYALVFRKPAR